MYVGRVTAGQACLSISSSMPFSASGLIVAGTLRALGLRRCNRSPTVCLTTPAASWPSQSARSAGKVHRTHATAALQEVQPSQTTGFERQKQQQPKHSPHSSKQTLDYTALAACCHELSNTWVPSKVEEVVQPDKFTLALRLRTPLSQGWLHLSWHPTAARVCMGLPPHRGDVTEAFSFAEQANVQLKGLILLSAHLPAPWERVVQLDFGTRPGEPPSRKLFCEVMAKYSNVVLTTADDSILQCAYQVGAAMSSLRQLQQGRPYHYPPTVNGIPPSADEPLSSWQQNITQAAALAAAEKAAAVAKKHTASKGQSGQAAGAPGGGSSNQETVVAGATRAYMGVSPALVEEICQVSNVSPTASPSSLNPQDWAALHGAWLAWLGKLHSGNFTASSCPSSGKFSVLGSYADTHDSVHDMIDSYYRSIQAVEVYGNWHQRLSSAVKQALKKARGKVYSFQQQLNAADGVAAVQKEADIIVANLYRIESKASELIAEDWDTSKQITLPLDPTKTPMEVAEGLYKKARKLRRAVDAVQPLLESAQQELEYLETVELELSQMPPGGAEQELAALREVQDELVESKVIKPPPEAALSAKAAAKGRKANKKQQKTGRSNLSPGQAAAAVAAGGAGPRQYISPSGLVVLVGRNNKQNDVLSHQIAKPGDIWMHVRGMPGSHTVIRLDHGQEPAQEDLQFAADLAAWFSKARDAGKADVIVARAESLKKFKGAKPGQVLVTKEEGNVVAKPGQSAAAAAVNDQ